MAIDKLTRSKGGIYRARIVLPGGRRVSKCFSRKVDAEMWEAKIKSEGHRSLELRRKQIRLNQFSEMFLRQHGEAGLALGTYQKYEAALRLYILPWFGDIWLDEISKLHIHSFRADLLKRECSDSTKNFIFSAFKTLMKKAVEWDLLGQNPAESVRPPRKGLSRTDYWNEAEVLSFLQSIRSSRRFPLYLIALNTGLRAGEIFGLQWDCVDLSQRLILIRRVLCQKTDQIKETTKTHRARAIGMNESLHSLLTALKSNAKDEFVLDRDSMGCGDSSHVARVLARDCQRAGVRVIRFHDLRHTYATQFVGKGGSIHALSSLLGHTTTAMTSRYAHFGPEHAKKAAQVVSFGAFEVASGQEVVTIQ
jgi:integrase